MITTRWVRVAALSLSVLLFANVSRCIAIDVETAKQLAAEDGDVKLAAIQKLVASADPAAIALLTALQDDVLVLFKGRLIIAGSSGTKD
ncbi:MAG TPA: hypothetical protein VE170_10865, partial [Candidatus Limnocylindria bacterium]|nr:hypothetical protein [Candidatus Limnocylindria bacterium]